MIPQAVTAFPILLSLPTCTKMMHQGSHGAPSNLFPQTCKHLLLADGLDQLIPHETGEHRIYLDTKNLAVNFPPSTKHTGSSPPSPVQSLPSSLLLTEKDLHESSHQTLNPPYRNDQSLERLCSEQLCGLIQGRQG